MTVKASSRVKLTVRDSVRGRVTSARILSDSEQQRVAWGGLPHRFWFGLPVRLSRRYSVRLMRDGEQGVARLGFLGVLLVAAVVLWAICESGFIPGLTFDGLLRAAFGAR